MKRLLRDLTPGTILQRHGEHAQVDIEHRLNRAYNGTQRDDSPGWWMVINTPIGQNDDLGKDPVERAGDWIEDDPYDGNSFVYTLNVGFSTNGLDVPGMESEMEYQFEQRQLDQKREFQRWLKEKRSPLSS